ncbi:Nin one binding Zn-ribbon like-domain-containing protein [Lenzites betulinus]|nr:Nin one binding Zn-ribbon like-domain-containing protein [Lenzites betulinus]
MAASTSSAAFNASKPACKHLVLDAGPLLSLSPLRGLSEAYYTVPQVLDELKDKRAREHFQQLGLSAGVRIEIRGPTAASLAHVIQWAKKTGDYSVLSHPDLCVLALTYELDKIEKDAAEKLKAEGGKASTSEGTTQVEAADAAHKTEETAGHSEDREHTEPQEQHELPVDDAPEEVDSNPDEVPPPSESEDDAEEDLQEREPLEVALEPLQDEPTPSSPSTSQTAPTASDTTPASPSLPPAAETHVYDDPSDEDDGEGEWITPSNVGLHKSRALDLLPSAGGRKGKKQEETIPVACMTADFAMQNVLLQMSLGLMGVEGKRIDRVKSWVLRCHACFKICKDASRKFCPSCGNPTLLRASVTISSPNAGPNTPAMQVHLKKNFQFKTRGTIFSIPAPKAGSSKTGPGEGLILREDQTAWLRAKKHADGKRDREEKRMLNAASKSAQAGNGSTVVSSWMDPDWVPEILSVGAGGKGRSMRAKGYDGDMPVIGYGKKNPNERRRKK